MQTRVLIADDHPLVLKGLSDLLPASEFIVVAACEDGSQAWKAMRELKPEIAVLDLRMPGLSAFEIARSVHREGLSCRMVLLTATVDQAPLRLAVQLGFAGIVTKDRPERVLLDVLRRVRDGEKVIPAGLAADPRSAGKLPVLSEREREIAVLAARGHRNRQIGELVSLTEGTVKIHLHKIYRKLGISSRVELVDLAHREGLV
jgi:two-component system NarL family response regulator/two-component system nitrate/nitrite response regulator NarL